MAERKKKSKRGRPRKRPLPSHQQPQQHLSPAQEQGPQPERKLTIIEALLPNVSRKADEQTTMETKPSPLPSEAADSSTAIPSEEVAGPNVDKFEAIAAEAMAAVGEGTPSPERAGAPDASPEVIAPGPEPLDPEAVIEHARQFGIPPEVFRKLLPHIGEALAKGLKDEVYRFEDYEVKMFAEALSMVANAELPALFLNANKPHLLALLVCASVYGIRVGADKWLPKIFGMLNKKKAEPPSDPPTQDSQQQTASSSRSTATPAFVPGPANFSVPAIPIPGSRAASAS
jgi:hypothetical protein